MPMNKTAIPIFGKDIAPRFDLATEITILFTKGHSEIQDKKTILLPRSSAEELCHILLSENINTLICGAIENEYYEFLKWKKIEVIDAVAGDWSQAFILWQTNQLAPGDILVTRRVEGKRL